MSFLEASNRIQAAFAGMLVRRSRRPVGRSKSKGLCWKRASFHIFAFFTAGVFIGLTTLLSVDMSENFASKHPAFSFDEDSAREKILLIDKPHNESHSVTKWFVKTESLSTASAMPAVPDADLVPPKLLIIVTPTYVRPFQGYYLNRLAQTLRNVAPPLLWMVVEKSLQSMDTAKVLRGTGVMYRHLVCEQNVTGVKDGGVHQRNAALAHIEKHHLDGMVYFADDDKIYSVGLFDQMRQIRRFGTWPVAMLSENKILLEGPVCNGSEVIGWHTDQMSRISRRFQVDMAGFAFNSTILWDPKRWQHRTLEPIRQHDAVKEGLQETRFIEQLVEDESQMEGLANNCSKIMVWHLHLEAPELIYPKGWLMQKNLEVVAPLT